MEILWVGDAACGSGFGRASSEILRRAVMNGVGVTVVGINYRGNPHDEPYRIWPAQNGGDPLGLGMLRERVQANRPDVVVVQTNPWNVPYYLMALRKVDPKGTIPMVGIIAVEGRNIQGHQLRGLAHAIFWTEFGRWEAEQTGMTCPSSVVRLGVDTKMFYPGDRLEARKALGLPDKCLDAFIVGNVNRNQHRKRLDLSIIYFADWWKKAGKPNAYLYLHALRGSGQAMALEQLGQYYGLYDGKLEDGQGRMILSEPNDTFMGVSDGTVRTIYQSLDVHWNTGEGEGFGLTTLEAMACRIPNMAGDIAALGEWGEGSMVLTPTYPLSVMPDVRMMLGAAPERGAMVEALHRLYIHPNMREDYAARGHALAISDAFNWDVLVDQYLAPIVTIGAMSCQPHEQPSSAS